MTENRSTRDLIGRIVRVAHNISENGATDEDIETIVGSAYEIGGRSLTGSMPSNSLMTDVNRLFREYLNIKFAVIGGAALALHGQARSTEDIDFLVDPFPDKTLLADKDEMSRYGFYAAKSSSGTVVQIGHRRLDGQYVELLASNTDLRRWAVQTAKSEMLLGMRVPVVTAEALVAMKVHAMISNPERTPKDLPDIISVLTKSNPKMEESRKYLSEEENAKLDEILKIVG